MNTHLIIGGTTKSGTTSLFQYLADHPEVCPSSMKETRFFLDRDYPLMSKYRYEDGIDKYNEFFRHSNGAPVLMEATPDYLYSAGTPAKIKAGLQRVKLVFILREPKSRFISWFNFSKQIGKLPAHVTLAEYINMQHTGDDGETEQHLMALEQGNYSKYLRAYYRHFVPGDVFVCFFEDLERNPAELLQNVASFVNIDPVFFRTYDFKRHNQTIQVRNQGLHKRYIALTFSIRKLTHNKKALHSALKKFKKLLNPLYMRLNSQRVAGEGIGNDDLNVLERYYSRELQYYLQRNYAETERNAAV